MDGTQLNLGDLASDGAQLRPHIVWFGEAVPMIEVAEKIVQKADIFVVIGTSLQVYPAAGLLHYVGKDVPKFIIDPNIPAYKYAQNTTYFAEKASVGMVLLKEKLLQDFK
jgi:NAD-dependent deacetylase